MKFSNVIVWLLGVAPLWAQPRVKVDVSADTIAVGGIVTVTYTVDGGDGKLDMPDLTGLPLISGPNTSSSFMYQNGKMSSNQSWSFRLRAMEEGVLYVPQATYHSKDDTITIQPVEIVVLADMDKPSKARSIPQDTSPASQESQKREKRKF